LTGQGTYKGRGMTMPATVAVCSLFRNGARTLDYYRGVLDGQLGDDIEYLFSF